MKDQLRFDGRVVVITGAGAGLGKAYALLFGSRGAKVVVNDLGGTRDGSGSSSGAADAVVNEIKANGGEAVADYNSVVDGDKIIKTALETFGKVDIIINNAGILRDRSFERISDQDWNLIYDVHVKGAFKTTQAAWPHLKKQKYGKVIFTTSAAGLFGNFGQANYSSAKSALIGLCNTLSIEGRKQNICCNAIAPVAASRLTEDILPPDMFKELKPELIAPIVAWLCHEDCTETGSVIESAVGWATKYALTRGPGALIRNKITDLASPENVRDKWSEITDLSNKEHVLSIQESMGSLLNHLDTLREGKTTIQTKESGDVFTYSDRDSIIYALGIGATVTNIDNLKYLYEGHENFSTFPTFAILPGTIAAMSSGAISKALPNKELELANVLHGEQYLEMFQLMPTCGTLTTTFNVSDVIDKGKHAVVIFDAETFNENGQKICCSQMSVFVINGGGFGGKRSSDKAIEPKNPPNRQPDKSVTQKTSHDQAALYRLSGDLNPLHIDPNFSIIGGFATPILHGLCSLGFSARHILEQYGNNDPAVFKKIKVRFVKPVLPGETLKTDMWREGSRVYFKTTSVETNNVVASGGYVELQSITEKQPANTSTLSKKQPKSDELFLAMRERLQSNLDKIKQINGIFVYNLTCAGEPLSTWTIDLKNIDIYKGEPKGQIKADTTLIADENDFIDMALGKLNPQSAFMKGKLKIKGNIMLVQKLKNIISTESKL